MPNEYDLIPLGEVATVRSGFAFRSRDWAKTGIPVVKIANVKDGRLVMEDCSFVPQGIADSAAEFALQAGDILIAMTGYIGDVARVSERDLPAALNQRVGRFEIREPRRLDQRFLFYLLRDASVRRTIEDLGYGSAQPNVSPSLIHGVEVSLPPLSEQRAIAHILGTLDDKIALNRRMSETLEAMARALFKSWFVDFDPVRAKAEGRDPGLPKPTANLFPARLVDSELDEIPEGWEVGTFAEVAELLRDHVNTLELPDTRFRHFSIPAFDEGQWPKDELGEAIKSQKSRVAPGVVLLSKLNPEIERVWLVDIEHDEQAVCSTEFLVLRPAAPFGRGFTYCLARSPLFRQGVQGLVTGTSKSHQRAQTASILGLPVVLPSQPTRQAFERQAEPLLTRSLRCRSESRILAAVRDTLLPKLISGELRVRDAVVDAGDPPLGPASPPTPAWSVMHE
jgi:type I restriction enzyme S subunit